MRVSMLHVALLRHADRSRESPLIGKTRTSLDRKTVLFLPLLAPCNCASLLVSWGVAVWPLAVITGSREVFTDRLFQRGKELLQ
jgi:hypothetical protein